MTRPARAALALALALLAGCAAGPDPADPGGRGPGLFAWSPLPTPAEVGAFGERCGRFQAAGSAACLAALAADFPDLAHALWLAEEPGPLRSALASAFAAAGDVAYRASDRARIRDRGAHDRGLAELRGAWRRLREQPAEARAQAERAAERFSEVDDALLAAEAELLAAAAALELGEAPGGLPEATVPVQRAARAFLALGGAYAGREPTAAPFAAARRAARAARHGAVLERLGGLAALGVGELDGGARRALRADLARAALARRRALDAVGHASAALARRGGDPERLLLARTFLAAGRAEAALAQLDGVEGEDPADRAAALALAGDANLVLDRTEDAVEAFAAAEAAYLHLGEAAAVRRQALDRATAALRAGRPAAAREALTGLADLEPAGPDLAARERVLRALVALVAGESDPSGAADAVDAALGAARAAGAYRVLEDYAGLPARLRSSGM